MAVEREAPGQAAKKSRGRVHYQDYLVIALGLLGLVVAKLLA
ncbi:MAG: hypothetical protein AB1776_03130 [Bacillota bacterium]